MLSKSSVYITSFHLSFETYVYTHMHTLKIAGILEK